MIGGALTAIGAPLLGVPIAEPLLLVAASLAAIMLFASLGVIVGIYAQTWDHHSFVSNLVIPPLAFVGGVFYSVDILPSPWQELSHANPLFYMVDAIRHGFLGQSDVSPLVSLPITFALRGRDVRVVGVAVPVRPQAEAIAAAGSQSAGGARRARGDQRVWRRRRSVDIHRARRARLGGGHPRRRAGAIGLERAPRSRRDVDVERDLRRHLKDAAGLASEWTYADVEAVHVRGRRTVIETDLPPRRREAGASLCIAAQRFSVREARADPRHDRHRGRPGDHRQVLRAGDGLIPC